MTTDWVYPSSLEELNELCASGRVTRLQRRYRNNNYRLWVWVDCPEVGVKHSESIWLVFEYRLKLREAESRWVYPSSLEELNAALQEERIEALEMRRRGDKKYYPATHCYRTPAKWDAHRYRYKLKEPKAMNTELPKNAYILLQNDCGIRIGDTVRIEPINVPPEMLGFPGWTDKLHSSRTGDECKVVYINSHGIGLNTKRDGVVYFPFFALRVMEKAPEILKVAGYDVAVHSGGAIRFGCTTINKRDVELIFGVWNGSNLPK